MHRSGTSCLTGLLADAGVFLGDVSKQNPYNLKGNHENIRIMRLHDEVLAANGGRWDAPPQGEVTWNAAQKASLQEILAVYRGQQLWAFKDPRTLFTLSAWQDAVPGLRFIGTFRHPGAVAQSLHRRGRLSADAGYKLWLCYNRRLLELQQTLGFDILCFDLERAAYIQSVTNAFRHLGLDVTGANLAFFEEELRNSSIEPMFAEPPQEVMGIYQHLRETAA
ncbi:MAG: sulfotransferase family protein [Gammaproteobacteria bacterium]|nr:sulfotransferase family protein [Gammaproteobacteria bacterium]